MNDAKAMGPWRFLRHEAAPGAGNMETDEALALELLETGLAPTLRVFRWNPWAISLGRHQQALDIDTARAAADGIDIVRRPTGGRAILHAEELTYSVVMTAGRKSVLDVYNEISLALLEGLRLFGVDAHLQRSEAGPGPVRRASPVPCFSSSARYEIEWRGRKLVGSAQRRYTNHRRNVVLQHGSILTGPAHLRLSRYIRDDGGDRRRRIEVELRERTISLAEILGTSVSLDDLAGCLRKGFESAWGVRFEADHHAFGETVAHG